MPQIILRPSGAGDLTQIPNQYPTSGSHYDKVDDVTSDGDLTYLWNREGSKFYYDSFAHAVASLGTGTINYVAVKALAKRMGTGQPAYIKFLMKVNGTTYYGSDVTIWNGCVTYTEFLQQWTTSPATGTTWNWTELDYTTFQFGFGLREHMTGWKTRATQAWVVIDYTEPTSGGCNVGIGDCMVF
jgi:hypothetical protein